MSIIKAISNARREYISIHNREPSSMAVRYDDAVTLLHEVINDCVLFNNTEEIKSMLKRNNREEIIDFINSKPTTVYGVKLTVVDMLINRGSR